MSEERLSRLDLIRREVDDRIARAVAAERERCARICEERAKNQFLIMLQSESLKDAAAAIRQEKRS